MAVRYGHAVEADCAMGLESDDDRPLSGFDNRVVKTWFSP